MLNGLILKKYSGVLYINGIDVHLNIGIGEEERAQKQDVALNITIHDVSQGAEDDYAQVVCYDKVICKILDEIEGREFKLIEYFAKLDRMKFTSKLFRHKSSIGGGDSLNATENLEEAYINLLNY